MYVAVPSVSKPIRCPAVSNRIFPWLYHCSPVCSHRQLPRPSTDIVFFNNRATGQQENQRNKHANKHNPFHGLFSWLIVSCQFPLYSYFTCSRCVLVEQRFSELFLLIKGYNLMVGNRIQIEVNSNTRHKVFTEAQATKTWAMIITLTR